MESPINTLKKKINELTDSQRIVADYIIKNPVDVAFLTVDQLSGIVGTSTTTIMRLTFKLGYSGYSEFQKGLQENLRNRTDPSTRLETNLKNVEGNDLWLRHLDNQLSNINLISQTVSQNTLNEAIEMINSAKHIYCISVRSGLPVSQFLTHGFNRLLGNCTKIDADSSDWVDNIIDTNPTDLFIVTSFPRYSKRIIELVTAAKKRNAKIISITDSYISPLAKYSDLLLLCNSESVASHNSVVPAMFLADYLVSAITINNSEKTSSRLTQVNEILSNMNYHHLKE